jgi:O-antigen/teichoic acid export membrane protein
MVFMGLCLALFSRELITLLTVKTYYSAADIAPFLIFGYVIRGGYYVVVTKIFYVKKATKHLVYITFSSALLNIGLNVLFVPNHSMMGAAWAEILTAVYTFGLTFFVSQKVYHIRYEYKRLILLTFIAFISISSFVILERIDLSVVLFIMLKVLIVALFFGLLAVFKFFSKSEIANLKDILRKVRAKYIH